MRNKRAKQIRKLVNCDLGRGTEDKTLSYKDVGSKYIGVISHDGNHDIREESVFEACTTEERYLYRQLKLVYKGRINDPKMRDSLITDLKQIAEKKSRKEKV